jgi:hypothetical protein
MVPKNEQFLKLQEQNLKSNDFCKQAIFKIEQISKSLN